MTSTRLVPSIRENLWGLCECTIVIEDSRLHAVTHTAYGTANLCDLLHHRLAWSESLSSHQPMPSSLTSTAFSI